jgi:hypothetical protein
MLNLYCGDYWRERVYYESAEASMGKIAESDANT